MSDMVGNRKAAKVTFVIMMVALICVSVYISFLFISGIKSANAGSDDLILDTGVVYKGVSSLGVDLSGTQRGQVPQALNDAAQKILDSIKLDFTINNKDISLSAQDIGAQIDAQALLTSAYSVGRQGDFNAREAGILSAETKGTDIPYQLTYDKSKLEQSVRNKTSTLNIGAKDAEIKINKTQDEANLMCDMTLTIEPETTGIDINYDSLLLALNNKMQSKDCFGGQPVLAEAVITQPKVTAEQLAQQYTKIAGVKTSYKTSPYGRRYNVWKMATIINGYTVQPGEIFDINKLAGPRTLAGGWQLAPGIESGQYVPQPGGGICQANSTLYNAVLRAELEIVDRTHHSWPLDYLPAGLDATISTGAPNFQFKNTLSTPIIISATVDGQAKTIEVDIYRSPMPYRLDFTSTVVSTSYSGGIKYEYNPSLPRGTSKELLHAHPRVVADVYKHVYDLNGNETVPPVLFYEDIYTAHPAIVMVGPNADGSAPAGIPLVPSS
ncbi:MAG: VanW family protein [Eubacteriales bacterium]